MTRHRFKSVQLQRNSGQTKSLPAFALDIDLGLSKDKREEEAPVQIRPAPKKQRTNEKFVRCFFGIEYSELVNYKRIYLHPPQVAQLPVQCVPDLPVAEYIFPL